MRFRPDIEGLRAVAVVAVILFHAEVPGVTGGYVGVDVFFAISGFLITGLLWREVGSTGTVKLGRFYGARARRLLPASAAVSIVTMIASALLLTPLLARTVIGDGIASSLYVSNYRFLLQGTDYFDSHMALSPFLHYWSLAVEEQFYLVWAPIILGTNWLIVRARWRRNPSANRLNGTPLSRRPYLGLLGVVTVYSFSLSFIVTRVVPEAAFYSLTSRAWQLAIGGLVALTASRWSRLTPRTAAIVGVAGLSLIGIACVRFGPNTPYPGTAALLPSFGATLVIVAGCAAPLRGCGRLLSSSPMRAVGQLSYSWYLWHWPVLVLAPALLGHPLGLEARLTAVLLSAGLAWLTLRFLENPLRFAPQIRESCRRSLALGGVATVVACCFGLITLASVHTPIGKGAPVAPLNFTSAPVPIGSDMAKYDAAVHQTFAEVQAKIAVSAKLKAVPSNLVPPLSRARGDGKAEIRNGCLLDHSEVMVSECVKGDPNSTTTVALIGDSHAAMWDPAFRQLADNRRWRLEIFAKGSCPLLDVPFISRRLNRRYTECEQWRERIIDRLRGAHTQLIVLSMTRDYDDSTGLKSYSLAWLDSLTRMVRQLRGFGAKVLVFGPVPTPQFDVPVCLSAHLDDATACATDRGRAVDESGIASESVATDSGGGLYADITNLFCAELCPVVVGNTLVYFDTSHITPAYSQALAPVIGTLADRVLASN